jgi:hypothetical protein
MDLPDGCGGEWVKLERVESFEEGLAQCDGQRSFRFFSRKSGDSGLQPSQSLLNDFGEGYVHVGNDLTEFHGQTLHLIELIGECVTEFDVFVCHPSMEHPSTDQLSHGPTEPDPKAFSNHTTV